MSKTTSHEDGLRYSTLDVNPKVAEEAKAKLNNLSSFALTGTKTLSVKMILKLFGKALFNLQNSALGVYLW